MKRAVVLGALTLVSCLGACAPEREPPSSSGVVHDLGSFGGATGDGGADASCTDGEVRTCKVQIDERNCFVGEQACVEGEWGDCTDPERLESAALSAASPCAANPCNPQCQTFDENPPSPLTLTPSMNMNNGNMNNGSAPVGSLPPAWQTAGLKDLTRTGVPCSASSDCQFDHYCDVVIGQGSAGECISWDQGNFNPGNFDPGAGAADLTLKLPCGSGDVEVCNRGSVTAPSGVEIAVMDASPTDFGLCAMFTGAVVGTCFTAVSVAPGSCETVSGCPIVGTKTLFVNAPDEAAFAPPGPIPESSCTNNWSVYHPNLPGCAPVYSPQSFAETYVGDCSAYPGTGATWDFFAYDTSIPGDAQVIFEMRTATTAAGLASATWVTVATATLGTEVVLPSSPLALQPLLGPGANLPHLELRMTLEPTTDLSGAPIVNSWDIFFSCLDNV